MSYCRFSDCDVYVYDDIEGGITIMTHSHGCHNEKTRSEAIKRLEKLRGIGLDVPDYVLEEIQTDLVLLGETIASSNVR